MPRATAASTMAPVLGPRRSSSSSSRRLAMAASASKLPWPRAASMSCWASLKAWRPTASSLYCTTTRYTPGSMVGVVRAKVTGQPAWACRASAAVCRTWASDRSVSPPSGFSTPMAGNSARSRASKPSICAMARSDSAQATTASMARWRLQRLGPRRALMRDTSMVLSFCLSGAGRVRGRLLGFEGLDARTDEVGGNIQRPGRGNGRQQGVGVGCHGIAAKREVGQTAQHMLGVARGQHHAVVLHKHGAARFFIGSVFHDGGQVRVLRVQHHAAVAQGCQRGDLGVCAVQHCGTVVQHHIHLGAQHLGHLLLLVYVECGEMLHAIHVGDHAHLATVIGQAVLQDGAGIVFNHGGLHHLVHQQAVRGFPVGTVAGFDAALVKEQAGAAGHTGMPSAQVQQPGHQAGNGGGAPRARNPHDGNAARVPGMFFGRKQVLHNRLPHGPRRPHGGLEVHQQAGARVHLHDGATLGVQRPGDVLCHEVDARNVQAHHLGGQLGDVGHLGVHVVGAVHGHVAVALHHHLAAGGGHGVGVEVLALEFELHLGILRHIDDVERVFLLVATARVGVELAVDQFAHRVAAVARDAEHLAARGGHDLAVDHEQTVLVAGDEALDHHVAAFGVGHVVGRLDVFLLAQVQRHAPAVVAVGGLDDHGQADVLRGFPGLLGAVDDLALGDGNAAGFQQALGQVLVRGNAFGNGAGEFALGRPDAALCGAVAQLHQVAVIQADVRNAAVGGSGHDAGRARAQVAVVHLGAHFAHGRLHVEGLVVEGGHDQPVALLQRHARDALIARPEHHAVDATHRGAARLAKARGHAGKVEQLDDDVLQHMAAPGAFLQALQETAAFAHAAVVLDQGRQPGGEPLIEPRKGVGGVILQHAQVQPDFEHRTVGPEIGAAQVIDAQQLNVIEFRHGLQRRRGRPCRGRCKKREGTGMEPDCAPVCARQAGAAIAGAETFIENANAPLKQGFGENPGLCANRRRGRPGAQIPNKMQNYHPVDALGVLNGHLGAGLRALLAPEENVRATLEVDLSADLRFGAGLLVVTSGRLLACDPGSGAWQEWPLGPGLSLRLLDHGGVGTLELHDAAQRLAFWRFTLGVQTQALRLVQRFDQQVERLARPYDLPADDAEEARCPTCHALLPPDTEECPACARAQPPQTSTWVLLRLWRFAHPYLKQLAAGFALTLASTAATLVPPYLTIPLMDDILIPFQNGKQIEPGLVLLYLSGLLASALAAWGLSWARTYILALVSERIGADLRTTTYEHLLRLSLDYFGGKRTGDLMARIGSETDRINVFLSLHALDFITDVLMIVMTAVILFSINPWLALVTLVPLPFIGWMIHTVRDRLRTGFEKIDRVWSEVTNVLADTIPGIRVVKAFAQEKREAQRFRDANQHNLEVNDKLNKTWSLFTPTVSLLTEIGLLVVWGFGIWLVSRSQITVGVLTAFIAYIGDE